MTLLTSHPCPIGFPVREAFGSFPTPELVHSPPIAPARRVDLNINYRHKRSAPTRRLGSRDLFSPETAVDIRPLDC